MWTVEGAVMSEARLETRDSNNGIFLSSLWNTKAFRAETSTVMLSRCGLWLKKEYPSSWRKLSMR